MSEGGLSAYGNWKKKNRFYYYDCSADNVLEELGRQIAGIKTARQNVLIAGGVGAVAGLVLSLLLKRRR